MALHPVTQRRIIGLAGVLLFVCLPAITAADYGYFGWTYNGCSSTPMDSTSYNSLDTWAVSQWWTISFTDNVQSLGGMINFVRVAAGAVAAIQVSLTNGEKGANQLVLATQTHPLGFSSGDNDDSFCIGSGDSMGCFEQQQGSVHATGTGTGSDGTVFKYDLTFTQDMADTWCMLDDASTTINVTSPQSVTWYHYAPAASVSGSMTLGSSSFSITGVGQQDHVYGAFIPTVTLFKHWIDAHFYNATSGFVMYWGAMGDSWAFARIEHPIGKFMFDNITHREYYSASNPNRPVVYSVEGSNANGDSFHAQYTVLVPGLDFGSNPVEDIVYLGGMLCPANGVCEAVNGRGWAQLMGGPTHSQSLFDTPAIQQAVQQYYHATHGGA